MAFTTFKTWVVGAVLPAADLNTYVRDNGNACVVAISTAAGDMTYATAANALARISSTGGSTGQILMLNTPNVPSWQAGLPKSGFFMGALSVNRHVESASVITSTTGDVAVTFALAYTSAPKVVAVTADGQVTFAVVTGVTTTGFSISTYSVGAARVQVTAHWMADGPN